MKRIQSAVWSMFRPVWVFVLGVALVFPAAAASAQGRRQNADNPEQGDVRLNARTRIRVRQGRSDGVRLAVQVRLDALNLLSVGRPAVSGGGGSAPSAGFSSVAVGGVTPVVTPGLRLLQERLFVGLGLGFAGASVSVDDDTDVSRGGFSFVPTASYDLLVEDSAALSIGGMLPLVSLGETETCVMGNCDSQEDDAFGLGLAVMAGLRAKLLPSLAIGGEFGWGLLNMSSDAAEVDAFQHGLLGMLLIETSIGL